MIITEVTKINDLNLLVPDAAIVMNHALSNFQRYINMKQLRVQKKTEFTV